jgi:regulation of enolase protein 1 (concanavalin A-like superfamily)
MVRNDIAEAGSSGGYAVVAVTRRNGVVFDWDSDGDGYLDSDVRAAVDTYRPIWVRLSRDGTACMAAYSYDGTNWVPLGSAVNLAGAADTQDGGIFSTSHDANRSATNVFSAFSVESTS